MHNPTTRTPPLGSDPFVPHGYGAESVDIVIKDGGCLDIAHTGELSYKFAIAGHGVAIENSDGSISYTGALRNTGNAIGEGTKQAWKITLHADASIVANKKWGLVAGYWGATSVILNGHTLTKLGTDKFILCNTTVPEAQSGAIRVMEGTLEIACADGGDTEKTSTLNNVVLTIEKNAKLELWGKGKIDGIKSLSFKAGKGGVGFTGVSNYQDTNPRPTVDASWILPSDVTPGETVTLLTDSAETGGFTEDLFAGVYPGGRFDADATEITAKTVTATVRDDGSYANFYHYDFNGGTSAEAAKATDTTYAGTSFDDVQAPTALVPTRNGKAAKIYYTAENTRYNPLWTANTADPQRSPFTAGVVTVTTVVKPVDAAAGKIIWGLGDVYNAPYYAVALVSENDNTLSVVKWTARAPREVLATVTGIKDLTKAYHFVSVSFTPEGTTLRVGNLSNSTIKTAPYPIAIHTQFGTVYGGAPEGDKRAGTECYIDDWQLFDARLTDEELRQIRLQLAPPPFILRFR